MAVPTVIILFWKLHRKLDASRLLRMPEFFSGSESFIIYLTRLRASIFFKSLSFLQRPVKVPTPPPKDFLAISQLFLHPQRSDWSGTGAKMYIRYPIPKDRYDMHFGTRGVPYPPEWIFGGSENSGRRNHDRGRDGHTARKLVGQL